jgi:hypothetical protein
MLPVIASELARVAIQKISEMKLDDAVHAIKTLQKAAGAPALLIPGIGIFGAGLAVGAGLGVLFAPRTGHETRKALRESVGRQVKAVRARFARPEVTVVSVSDAEPQPANGGSAKRTVPEA